VGFDKDVWLKETFFVQGAPNISAALLILAATLLPVCLRAQSTNTTQFQAPKAGQKNVVKQPGPLKVPKQDEQIIFYSGFFVDLRRAEKPLKMLSLRKPADPVHDADNLLTSVRTGKPVGFRLFSLDF
jgi:hypothetical protein